MGIKMTLSNYFLDLLHRYISEIDDLRFDTDGQDVLHARLREKRDHFAVLLRLKHESPELLLPAFHGAFNVSNNTLVDLISTLTPADPGFSPWDELMQSVVIHDWAKPLAHSLLQSADGDKFLITAIVLNHLYQKGTDVNRAQAESQEPREDAEPAEDDEPKVLDSSGDAWLHDHGFDPLDR